MIDIKYVAGFFDGEGSFMINIYTDRRNAPKKIYKSYIPTVQVNNTNFEIIYLIGEFLTSYGVPYTLNERHFNDYHKDQLRISIRKRSSVAAVCSILFPHLIVKKQEAGLLLDFVNEDNVSNYPIYHKKMKKLKEQENLTQRDKGEEFQND